MLSIINHIKNNKKNYTIILLLVTSPITIPLFSVLVQIIFSLGKYIGTIARIVSEGICP